MKKYILAYKQQVNDFISGKLDKSTVKEIDEFLKNMETMIGYFQHERLIHLIVTMTFAMMEILVMVAFSFVVTPALCILAVLFLALLIPYVFHYYLLENTVQEFYKMRDKILSVRKTK